MNELCPHCGKRITDIWEYFHHTSEGETIDFDCPLCEKPIHGYYTKDITYNLELEPGESSELESNVFADVDWIPVTDEPPIKIVDTYLAARGRENNAYKSWCGRDYDGAKE